MMLFRFSLYGFLKNQRYFEPFLLPAFLEKGLSFFLIGLLIACRELTVVVMEIPSGAIADLWGRRRSMMISFSAYILSFAVLATVRQPVLLFLAMILFGIGDAFRTGTHKAIIFSWLKEEGREDEKTKVYGYTRSWSKIGSATSVLIAAIFVFVSKRYELIFFFSIIPSALNIINFMGYPSCADATGTEGGKERPSVFKHMRQSMTVSFSNPSLRRLILEAMGFDGLFRTAKDYLQPLLVATATLYFSGLHSFEGAELSKAQRGTLLIGPVYFLLYLLSAVASRKAHRVTDRLGGEDRGARFIWAGVMALYASLAVFGYLEINVALILGFITLHVLQNLFRPILISRFSTHSEPRQTATVLSIESQASRLTTMVIAPLLGFAIDAVTPAGKEAVFWPIGIIGFLLAAGFVIFKSPDEQPPSVSEASTEQENRDV